MSKRKPARPKRKAHAVLNAKPEQLIAWFDDFDGAQDWAAFSNFYEGEPLVTDIRYGLMFGDEVADGLGISPDARITAPTGEHLFAAFKACNANDFLEVIEADGPGAAKGIGKSIVLRSDWEAIKLDVMAFVLRLKFTLDRAEGATLLASGDALLIEGTFWGDRVWGVDLTAVAADPLSARGRNWLGSLLMMRRAELRAEQAFGVRHLTKVFNQAFAL